MTINYRKIANQYEFELEQHQTGFRAVGWPRVEDTLLRFIVMLDLLRNDIKKPEDKTQSLIDIGCGLGHLFEFIQENQIQLIQYSGLDISPKYIDRCEKKFPETKFYCCDLLAEEFNVKFDFAVMNGVFTQKFSIGQDEMFTLIKVVLKKVFSLVNKGMAFNVMSPKVDFKKEGAFHLDFSILINFIVENLSRNFVIRHDYGLYEYTCYVYKETK